MTATNRPGPLPRASMAPALGAVPRGEGWPPSDGPVRYSVRVSFMPSAASLKATPWVVETMLITTPFWFFMVVAPAPPPTVAPAAAAA